MEQISGPKRFFRFAWPCAQHRLNANLITQANYNRLLLIKEQNLEPEMSFLRECFPDGTNSLEDLAIQKGREMWSPENVADFCRHHQGTHKGCSARVATVVSLGDKKVVVIWEGKTLEVTNDFNLDIQPGDNVLIHISTIVDKIDE